MLGSITIVDPPALVRAADAAPAGGTATYGVQRTTKSGKPLWRDSGCLELVYDATSIDAQAARVIDTAFATWTNATLGCGQLAVTSTRRPDPASARDELSTVRIRTERWCNPGTPIEAEVCYPHEASAITRLLFIDDPADPDDGKIIDADIELNGVDYVLLAPGAVPPATTKPVLDLQAVVTHEAGHALGLAHDCGTGNEPWPADETGTPVPSCLDASPQVRAATMYYVVAPGDVGARSVESTDVAAACQLARGLTCDANVTGGCDSGRGGAGLLVVVLVSAFSLASAGRGARPPCPRASRRCRPSCRPTAR